MSASYSGITASDNTRLHVGASYDNSNTSTTFYNYSQARPKPKRRWFGSRVEEKEQRKRDEAFLKAVKEKQKPRAEYWFAQGVDVDFVDEYGYTALHYAAMTGHLVDYLLAKGYDINAQNTRHGTPLCIAAFNGRTVAVQQLVTAHADLRCCGTRLPPALHSACSCGHLDIARILVEAGAPVSAQADWPKPRGEEPSITLVDTKPDFVTERATPLAFAVDRGWFEIATTLLSRGADPKAALVRIDRLPDSVAREEDISYYPLLLPAGQRGSLPMIELLLRHGADPNACVSGGTQDGCPPLAAAVLSGHATAVEVLLSAGARVDKKDKNGWTALHLVAFGGDADGSITKVLLAHDADVAIKNKDGSIALHLAAMSGEVEVARLLLEAGASATEQDQRGITPLPYANQSGHFDIVELLIDRGAHVNTPGHVGMTALHHAALFGNVKVVQSLLARGADVNARDANRVTALHWAAHSGFFEVAQILLDSGADVAARNGTAETPLHSASVRGHMEVAALLLHRGADDQVVDQHGNTPHMLACRSGNAEIEELFATQAVGRALVAERGGGWRGPG